jgi:phosphatidylserine decarboxylase
MTNEGEMAEGAHVFIAKEGLREILLSTLLLCALAALAGWVWWPLAIPFAIVWVWVLSFFRDPPRVRMYAAGDICSAADGTVTEVVQLNSYEGIDGPAIRIGAFLSLFNVHVNRSPCRGTVRSTSYKKGEFRDARDPLSGERNEAMTIVIDPDPPIPGPVIVRQVAGLVARRIICHAKTGDQLAIGERFGLIKFGSRTEVVMPLAEQTEVLVKPGDRVRGGLTIIARQAVEPKNLGGGPGARSNEHRAATGVR